MNFVIDILILAIIFATAFWGYKKGFINISVTSVGIILSFILAFALSPVAAEWTYDTFVQEKMVSAVNSTMTEQGNVAIETAVENVLSQDNIVTKMAKVLGVSSRDFKSTIPNDSFLTASEHIEREIIHPPIVFLLRIIYLILLLVVLLLLFRLLSKLLSKAFTLTVAKKADPVFGCILGVLLGMVFAMLFCALIDALLSVFPDGFIGITFETRDDSYLYRLVNYIYTNGI